MAKRDKEPRDPVLRSLRNLDNATANTNERVYGISKDIPGLISYEVDSFIDKISLENDNNKALINSHISRNRVSGYANDTVSKNGQSIFDIINDKDMLASLEGIVGSENMKFAQMLKDYEIIKRCIPQVHKVINSLKNSILSPDAMTSSAIGIHTSPSTTKAEKDQIDKIIDKYKLNEKLDRYVLEYLIASVKYISVVPYKIIPDMLTPEIKGDPDEYMENRTVQECIDYLKSTISEPKSLLEYSYGANNSDILTEAVDYYELDETSVNLVNQYKEALNEVLSNITFVNGGMEYYKNAILNEAIVYSHSEDDNKSMKKLVKILEDKDKSSPNNHVVKDKLYDGLVSPATIRKIRKNVDFKGAHIEELQSSKIIAFRMRGTTIGYFYVEDYGATDPNRVPNNKLTSIMDKINSSIYMNNDNQKQVTNIQDMVVKSIVDRLIKVINDKFINDNYEDLDILYEFVKANELYIKPKKIVFFHPDDICEFKREDGSIMKNCMFLAKLWILTILSNVITNVTRGADRNLYYVKTGLSTDIEGHVNSAIRAIKQGQIRYSDTGTINEIFNLVGSNVDVFMPVSVDGEKPIEVETVSGQNVDMNNEFLTWMLRSIIQSFGVPASVIDDYENVEFAKTIAMSNIDMAKAVLQAQNEIAEPLTKMVRAIVEYEMPEYQDIDEIEVTLNPPSILTFEMNRERMGPITEMAEALSALLIPPENETKNDKALRLFKLAYFKENMPNLDWPLIEELAENAMVNAKIAAVEDDIKNGEDEQ